MTRCPLCGDQKETAALAKLDPHFSFILTAVRTGHLCAGCLRVFTKDDKTEEGTLPILVTQSEHHYKLCESCSATAREAIFPFMWHLVTTLGAAGHA